MLVVGCLLVGIGIGMVFDNAGAGVMVGLGVGFILETLVSRKSVFPFNKKSPRDSGD